MDFWKTAQVIMISLMGGIVRYLVDFLSKAEETVEDISIKLLIIHAIIGTFAGFLSYMLATYIISSFMAGLLAAGIGSFGSYGTLFWLLEFAKKRLVVMDESLYNQYKKLRQDGYFDQEKK